MFGTYTCSHSPSLHYIKRQQVCRISSNTVSLRLYYITYKRENSLPNIYQHTARRPQNLTYSFNCLKCKNWFLRNAYFLFRCFYCDYEKNNIFFLLSTEFFIKETCTICRTYRNYEFFYYKSLVKTALKNKNFIPASAIDS